MSQLTSMLMGRSGAAGVAKWRPVLAEATVRLVAEYGTPTLGNYRDPIKEIFYILLSARTSEVLYQRAHRNLFRKYGTLQDLAAARVRDVNACIRGAGLGAKRAGQVVATAKRLVKELGPTPRSSLRAMTATESFEFLTRLPGLGPKSALCVMMCSLDHDVFPVDVNVQRVFERMGILPRGLKHYQAQQRGPRFVPDGRCKDLHVGLVEHGRRLCLPNRPKCGDCLLLDLCRHGLRRMDAVRVRTADRIWT